MQSGEISTSCDMKHYASANDLAAPKTNKQNKNICQICSWKRGERARTQKEEMKEEQKE